MFARFKPAVQCIIVARGVGLRVRRLVGLILGLLLMIGLILISLILIGLILIGLRLMILRLWRRRRGRIAMQRMDGIYGDGIVRLRRRLRLHVGAAHP